MSLKETVLKELARAPRVEDRVNRASWRRRGGNRVRSYTGTDDAAARDIAERLGRDGIVITDVDAVFGDRALFDAAEEQAKRLYEGRPRQTGDEGSKGTYLTELTDRRFAFDDPFAKLALHPRPLAIANTYVGLRTTLRALELWLTYPAPGPAVQTQLWHRDGDDLINLKMFVYFTDVTRAAGPLSYARGSQPLGRHRKRPEHDDEWRSTDEQMAGVIPQDRWLIAEGKRGTVVFADTCGYHKQLKPETDERLLLMSQYVSAEASVPRAVEITGADESSLSDDQYVAALARAR